MEYPMSAEDYTVMRIAKVSLKRIQERAFRNHRSVPKEIDFLIEIVDAVEASGMNVIKIETLPRPAGAQAVPVVYVGVKE
jgi:hypothetical protein